MLKKVLKIFSCLFSYDFVAYCHLKLEVNGEKNAIDVGDLHQILKMKRIKMSRITFFLLVFLSFAGVLSSTSLEKIVEKIPPEDRKTLEELFFSFVYGDNFGYTLFGDKAVALSACFKITPWENFLELGEWDGLFWKKWETWEKYKTLFPIREYILTREKSSFGAEFFFLINKKTFIGLLKNNLETFEAILKINIHPEQFISKIENGETSFLESINNSEMLLGMCLGYGKWNALLFSQRDKIFKNDCLKFFGSYERSLLRISSVHFMADPDHEETLHLKEKYDQLRGKLSAIYAKGNFFEITVEQLIKVN